MCTDSSGLRCFRNCNLYAIFGLTVSLLVPITGRRTSEKDLRVRTYVVHKSSPASLSAQQPIPVPTHRSRSARPVRPRCLREIHHRSLSSSRSGVGRSRRGLLYRAANSRLALATWRRCAWCGDRASILRAPSSGNAYNAIWCVCVCEHAVRAGLCPRAALNGFLRPPFPDAMFACPRTNGCYRVFMVRLGPRGGGASTDVSRPRRRRDEREAVNENCLLSFPFFCDLVTLFLILIATVALCLSVLFYLRFYLFNFSSLVRLYSSEGSSCSPI